MLEKNDDMAPILTFGRLFSVGKPPLSCRKGPAGLQRHAYCRATSTPSLCNERPVAEP